METAPLFPLGQVLITPGAEAMLTPQEIKTALHRHQHGDYGDIDEADAHLNNTSAARCCMVMSVYLTVSGAEYWIQTHGARSHTLILLPGE